MGKDLVLLCLFHDASVVSTDTDAVDVDVVFAFTFEDTVVFLCGEDCSECLLWVVVM